jgi:hypothetical protein
MSNFYPHEDAKTLVSFARHFSAADYMALATIDDSVIVVLRFSVDKYLAATCYHSFAYGDVGERCRVALLVNRAVGYKISWRRAHDKWKIRYQPK